METRLLVDAIVQQTTLLIAHLGTRAGLRAPLAHIADQVFLELANEIEAQGVSRNVAADMFGLALRSYQKKVTRLRASVTQDEQTLWQSVLQFVAARDRATRQEVLSAFAQDEETHVVAVLNDLVASGLLYGTGRGKHASYRARPAQEREVLACAERLEALLHLLWLEIADRGAASRADLQARFPAHAADIDKALAALVEDGRVEVIDADGQKRFRTSRVLIPAGTEAGWETAVLDHFRAMCVAIASKLSHRDPAAKGDLVGGTTLSFDLQPGHPHEAEVKALLGRFRAQAGELWERVSTHNQAHPVPDPVRTKVVFYFGQNVIEPEGEEGP
jgi:hypothetical protein